MVLYSAGLELGQVERLGYELVRPDTRGDVRCVSCDHHFVGFRSRDDVLNAGADLFVRAYDLQPLVRSGKRLFLRREDVRHRFLGLGMRPGRPILSWTNDRTADEAMR